MSPSSLEIMASFAGSRRLSIIVEKNMLMKSHPVKYGNFKKDVFLEHPNKQFVPSSFDRALEMIRIGNSNSSL